MSRIWKTRKRPSFTSIDTFKYSITRGYISSNSNFSTSNINNIWIIFSYCNSTNTSTKESIRNIFICFTSILSFPNSTSCCAKVKKIRITWNTRNCRDLPPLNGPISLYSTDSCRTLSNETEFFLDFFCEYRPVLHIKTAQSNKCEEIKYFCYSHY